MRIAHVVTYISREGAFGGPVAVAMAQTQALAALGHDVELIATWDGLAEVNVPGVLVRLFPIRRRGSLTSIFSLPLVAHLHRRRSDFDVVHLHFGRDLVSLSAWAALRAISRRVVLQPHGMVQPDHRVKARVVDRLLVRRALRHSKAVLALTAPESEALVEVAAAPIRPLLIRNGITVPTEVEVRRSPRSAVLFLARLHPRKNVMVFARAALALRDAGHDLRFRVVGPDEGDLDALRSFIQEHQLQATLEYGGVVGPGRSETEMREARLYVLPSVGEIYPMTVLEALAQGTPAVVGEDSALGGPLREAHAAFVVRPTVEEVADAIFEATRDEAGREVLARAGHAYARSTFDIGAVAQQLATLYGDQR